MTETPQPEPDWGKLLKTYGKNYLQFMGLALEKGIQQLERTPTVRQTKKPIAKQSIKDLGILGWLKGPRVEERKDS
jgi:hypothetical protein